MSPQQAEPKKAKYGENNEKLPDELKLILKDLVKKYETEDSWVRKQQIKLWKKNDEFWHGVQYIFWSESRQDWISPTETRWFQQEEGREEAEGPFYDYVINIYKAHGEAIISALSAQLPQERFPPDDADNDDDITTSKTYSKISDLIQRHNKFKVVFLRALFTLWNQGIVAAYHAPRADKAFGEVLIPNYKKALTCENCEQEKPLDSEDLIEGMPCPTCGSPMMETPVLDGYSSAAKSRVIIDIFGGLHVKIPYYARTQKECGYLILNLDQPIAFLKHLYPHVAEEIESTYQEIGQYERIARAPSSFSSSSKIDESRDLRALRRVWMRPWVLDGLRPDQEKEAKQLKKLFPNGIYCAFIGEVYVESRDEDLDKHWTIGQAGLSQYIHSDAIGQPLIPIQELTNIHVNLTEETIEHGIPSTFADPDVLNFTDYSRHEVRPGMVFPATARPGQTMAQSFYESGRATVSKELFQFSKQLEQYGQFTIGSFPSIFGGPGDQKSRTASEYNMSRQMALQRLSIAWSLISHWKAQLMEKAVHLYIENLLEDERYVKSEGQGSDVSYANVWIRKAELTGHVGEVECESAETFPVSTPQKQALLLKLIEMNNDFINAAVFDPQNRSVISDILSFPDLEIPGEDQRLKQKREISQMLRGEPVIVEPMVDDHAIHFATLRHFMASDLGAEIKATNPLAYELLSNHLMTHMQLLQAQTAQQFGSTPPGEAPDKEVEK